jgi:hypothetical protein
MPWCGKERETHDNIYLQKRQFSVNAEYCLHDWAAVVRAHVLANYSFWQCIDV